MSKDEKKPGKTKSKLFGMALYRVASFWAMILVVGIILSGLFILPVFIYFGKDLPDYKQLLSYDPPTISRIYSSEGDLLSELAVERRIFRKLDEIPQLVINAFIAAEDQNYFSHPGIDVTSIARAALQNLSNIGTDRNPVGGSTITQQVVKNFLLTNERSISRKIKEAILAYRITKVYSKERILELYLNQIYLGNGTYGVTSAALGYYNKDLKSVTVAEAALLAALPKAPSLLDPTKNPERAKARRDWVLDRMYEDDYITKDQLKAAKETPINLTSRFESSLLDNGYYNESVRLELIERYGFDFVYQEGISVFTNLNKELQKYADDALRYGLIEYEKRHGYRGPITNISFKGSDWQGKLKALTLPPAAHSDQVAVVIDASDAAATIGFIDGTKGTIALEDVKWARLKLKGGGVGKAVERIRDVMKPGDVILAEQIEGKETYGLIQIPEVNGALVAMEAKTGKVLAMSGGYSFKDSKYNRAIQAMRQPGSAFKPFVYLSALEKGYGPTSIVKDSPITISQGPGKPAWTPKNYEGKYLGNITLRKALEKSRNLATVYLITKISARKVGEVATRLGVYDSEPPAFYSMALGAVETTPIKLTGAYAVFANGGNLVKPKLIDRIQDRKGNLVFSSDDRKCIGCNAAEGAEVAETPEVTFQANYVVDPMLNYQLVSILQGVVDRGTAVRARRLGKILAGKTGTSNESMDTWFIGFSPDIVVGVFVGYDTPRSLGAKEQGGSVALPIFIKFMEKALAKMPNKAFEVPEGIKFVDTGYDSGTTGVGFGPTVAEPIRPGAVIVDDASTFTATTPSEEDAEHENSKSPEEQGVY